LDHADRVWSAYDLGSRSVSEPAEPVNADTASVPIVWALGTILALPMSLMPSQTAYRHDRHILGNHLSVEVPLRLATSPRGLSRPGTEVRAGRPVTAMKRWLVIGLLVLAPVLLPRPPVPDECHVYWQPKGQDTWACVE
jgi:hypothetical protein